MRVPEFLIAQNEYEDFDAVYVFHSQPPRFLAKLVVNELGAGFDIVDEIDNISRFFNNDPMKAARLIGKLGDRYAAYIESEAGDESGADQDNPLLSSSIDPANQKPKIGESCNGCGLCCKSQVCGNGAYLMKLVDKLGDRVPGPCPALEFEQGRYSCGLVLYPKKYIKSAHSSEKLREAIKVVIGAGFGCDELLPDDSEEEESRLDEMIQRAHKDPVFLARVRSAMKLLYNIDA